MMLHRLSLSKLLIASAFACGCLQYASAQIAPPAAQDPSRRTEGAVPTTPAATLHTDAATDQHEWARFDAFAPSGPGDNDIGEQMLLRQRERVREFLVQMDAFGYWTNNAAHVSKGAIGDWFWGTRASVGWQPRLSGYLFGDVGVSQDIFRYDQFNALDFESFEATAGLIYVSPRLENTALFVQYDFNRLTQDFDDLNVRHAIRAGAQKVFIINHRHTILAGLSGSWDFDNDVDALKRNEYSANAAWVFKVTRDWRTTLSYRYSFFDYTEVGRQDHFHNFGLNVVWSPKKWLELYAGVTVSLNNSNFSVYDYDAVNLGGGIGARIRF
jgi:hypothetical protein